MNYNTEVARLIMFKSEHEAKKILKGYKARYRITHREGSPVLSVVDDRDDRRYSIIIENGVVARVSAG